MHGDIKKSHSRKPIAHACSHSNTSCMIYMKCLHSLEQFSPNDLCSQHLPQSIPVNCIISLFQIHICSKQFFPERWMLFTHICHKTNASFSALNAFHTHLSHNKHIFSSAQCFSHTSVTKQTHLLKVLHAFHTHTCLKTNTSFPSVTCYSHTSVLQQTLAVNQREIC